MWTNEGPALWLASDNQTVVPDGDPRAAFLLVGAGGQIPLAEAEKYGLAKKAGKVEPPAEEQKGKVEPPPNKAKEPPPNKSKG